MAARRRPWRTAGHVTTKLANREPTAILKQSKSPIFLETRDLLFARVFLAPTRHLESGDGPGDEVGVRQTPPVDKVGRLVPAEFHLFVYD